MPATLKILRSTTPGASPSSLASGQIAINEADGVLFYRTAAGSVSQFSSGGGAAVYAATSNFPATGSSSTIYLATSTNRVYRWDSTGAYVEIGAIGGLVDADGGNY